jgi:murein L,D-transpeptidase YafK
MAAVACLRWRCSPKPRQRLSCHPRIKDALVFRLCPRRAQILASKTRVGLPSGLPNGGINALLTLSSETLCARGVLRRVGRALSTAVKRFMAVVVALAATLVAVACTPLEIPPYLRPLSKDTMTLLAKKGMTVSAPTYIRVFKEESELELWKQRDDGRYYHFKTYPICNWSGGLGPKLRQGDKQAPEGFYRVPQNMMNPNSQFHLAFNLGFPNAFDRANNRTGDFLMIHGKCRSAGCYAMTDALMEEIYALARESFIGGQEFIHVDAFPFRMTAANLERHKSNPNYKFWLTLKEGYDFFETARQPASVVVCERRYVVNARHNGRGQLRGDAACPPLERVVAEPFTPLPAEAASNVVVPGPRARMGLGAPDAGGFSPPRRTPELMSNGLGPANLGFNR